MNYPILALIITNIIWGAGSPIMKFALQNVPLFTLAFIRFFVPVIIFLPAAIYLWKKISLKDCIKIAAAGFFGVTVNITFFYMGLTRGGASINAPIIASAGPVFLFLLAVFFLREKPVRRVFGGMLISLIGVILIIASPLFSPNSAFTIETEIAANFFFVLATIGAVLDPLIAKPVLKKITPYQFIFLSFFMSSLLFFPFAVKEWQTWSITEINNQGILGIFYGIFLSSAVAYLLFYWGLSKIKAQEVGIFTYIDPIAALVVAWFLLGEKPNFIYIIASVLVFAGIFIAEKRIHWHPLHKLKIQNAKFKI